MKYQVLAAGLALAALAGCKKDEPVQQNIAPALPIAAAAPAEADKLAKVIGDDNIGRRIDIFERTAGSPTDATATSSTYVINGCTVKVQTENRAITSIEVALNEPKCSVDIGPFVATKRIVDAAHPLTYGELEKLMQYGAEYRADCLGHACGNANYIEFRAVWPGVHANNYREITALSEMGGPGNEKQVDAWVNALMKLPDGEDYLGDTECTRGHDDVAKRALATATVDVIRISEPVPQSCDSSTPATPTAQGGSEDTNPDAAAAGSTPLPPAAPGEPMDNE